MLSNKHFATCYFDLESFFFSFRIVLTKITMPNDHSAASIQRYTNNNNNWRAKRTGEKYLFEKHTRIPWRIVTENPITQLFSKKVRLTGAWRGGGGHRFARFSAFQWHRLRSNSSKIQHRKNRRYHHAYIVITRCVWTRRGRNIPLLPFEGEQEGNAVHSLATEFISSF